MPNKITLEECQKRIDTLYPNEFIKILNYEKMSAPCSYKCLICNTESKIYKASDLFKKKHICNNCWYSVGKGEKTLQYKEEALQIFKNNNTLEFVSFGYNKKLMKPTIKFKCLDCGLTSELQLIYFIKKQKCPGCSYNAKHLTTKGILKRIPKDLTLLEEYKGTDTKILIRHEECGFIWKTCIHNILQGCGCPKCSKRHSKGEQKIIKWLENKNIVFSTEQKFDWSDNKRYDFYLPEYNLLIEYMGIQHFKEVPFFNKTLKEQKQIDDWKKEKALLHSFQYYAISYEDYENIETILAQRLSRKESRD